MLDTLLKLQVDLPAHEVNEDLQLVLGPDAWRQGPSVPATHCVALAARLPPVQNLVAGKKISQFFYSKNNVSLVVLHHHPLHLQVQDTRVHHDRLPESHITIPEQRTFIIQQRL